MKRISNIVIFFFFLASICTAQEKEQNNFEDWDNKPEKVVPGEKNSAPSDAIILFADNLDSWNFTDGTEVTWPASKKGFKVVPKTPSINTRQAFGSCQLHVEWRMPTKEDHGKTLD